MRTMAEAARAEQIRQLRSRGISEVDAIRQTHTGTQSADNETVGAPPTDHTAEPGEPEDADSATSPDDVEGSPDRQSDRQFVIVTKDFSGLGWAKKLTEEGETVTLALDNPEDDSKDAKLFDQVGHGWLKTMPLKQAMAELQSDSTYWVFAENCFIDAAEKLIKAGQRVFGTSTLSERMEHDRAYAVGVAEACGLGSPATESFATVDEGVAFLDEHGETAYVFKPDSSEFNHLTFVPGRVGDADANRELAAYLAHIADNPGPYILQERLPKADVLEVNVEVWLYEGQPLLAVLGLELKRKDTGDLGEMAGCAGDFMQLIPLDSPLVKQTVGLMLPFYKDEKYTGTADVNCLITPDGVPHFLEVCDRLGYNAHVTMLLGLLEDGQVGQLIADFTDGVVDGIAERFKKGVAGSLTLFLDHPRPGLPLHIDDRYTEQFYPFDGYKEDDTLLLTGYSNEIGILVQYGATIEAATAALYARMNEEAVACPDSYWRTDVGESPGKRMADLKRRKLL